MFCYQILQLYSYHLATVSYSKQIYHAPVVKSFARFATIFFGSKFWWQLPDFVVVPVQLEPYPYGKSPISTPNNFYPLLIPPISPYLTQKRTFINPNTLLDAEN
ncbi:hypothetical protein Hanom_Chr17g01534421 [Helianthus anomalus]